MAEEETATRGWFATQILLGVGAPPSRENIRAMLSWMQGENTRAKNNPLATMRPGFGGTRFNEAGVKSYPSRQQGVDAIVDTLKLSYYTGIVDALRRGSNPQELQSLVAASKWGTGSFGNIPEGSFQEAYSTSVGAQVKGYGYFGEEGETVGAGEVNANDFELLRRTLDRYGLGSLYEVAQGYLIDGYSSALIPLLLKDTPQFKDRFKGMAMREEQGLPPISTDEYLALEDSYRNLFRNAGLPQSFYDSPEDFANFIGNDMSAGEVETRLGFAQQFARSVDPQAKAQLQELYGVSVKDDGDLMAYFLDPDRAVSLFDARIQAEAAGISAAAANALGTGLDRSTAERLAQQGVSASQVREFATGKGAFTQTLFGQRRGLTSSETVAGMFGFDSDSVADLVRLRKERQALAERKSGAALGNEGLSGFGVVR